MSILSDFSREIGERMPMDGSEVLDIGCGDGSFVRELARLGAHVTGLECSAAQLALCHQAAAVADESYVAGVGQALPFPANRFDAAVFRASLHHVPASEMTRALREARRVTRPGGEIFVFEPPASGSFFELVRLIDDETAVRGLAQQAIGRAVEAGWLARRHSAQLTAEVVYADLDAVRRRFVAIDGVRAALFDARREEIERVFNATGVATECGRLFTQAFRLDVLA